MTTLWGESIHVISNEGLPYAFIWRAQEHRVAQIAAYYRMDAYWWRERLWRDVFTVLTHSHLAAMIYHDLVIHEWFLLRLYD